MKGLLNKISHSFSAGTICFFFFRWPKCLSFTFLVKSLDKWLTKVFMPCESVSVFDLFWDKMLFWAGFIFDPFEIVLPQSDSDSPHYHGAAELKCVISAFEEHLVYAVYHRPLASSLVRLGCLCTSPWCAVTVSQWLNRSRPVFKCAWALLLPGIFLHRYALSYQICYLFKWLHPYRRLQLVIYQREFL